MPHAKIVANFIIHLLGQFNFFFEWKCVVLILPIMKPNQNLLTPIGKRLTRLKMSNCEVDGILIGCDNLIQLKLACYWAKELLYCS